MDRQPWERLDNETDTAYEAFSQYLELPKCGKSHDHGKPGGRRFKSDLARLRGIKTPTIEGWYRKYNWVGRAQAYDKFMSAGIQPIAELDARKDFVREIPRCGQQVPSSGSPRHLTAPKISRSTTP